MESPVPENRPDGQESDSRRMVVGSLGGRHSYGTLNGVEIHIWRRGDSYIARGSYEGRRFGVQLGRTELEAEARLHEVLVEIAYGTFVRPSQARRRRFKRVVATRLTLRQIFSAFVAEKRKTRGHETSMTYASRLAPVLDFAERPNAARRWRLADDIDRAFAIDLKSFLVRRQVSRNGRVGGQLRPMSERGIRNVLEAFRTALGWAVRADVRNLPADFTNPITPEIIGAAPIKDPLRAVPLPLEERIKMLEQMDDWQFLNLSSLLVLPLRPEDVARALISDFDVKNCSLRLGTHFGGLDFSKGKVDVTMPLATELVAVFRICVGERVEGPLFQSRNGGRRRRGIRRIPNSRDELFSRLSEELAKRPSDEIQAPADQKRVFGEFLCKLGGLSTQRITREIRKLLPSDRVARAYDLRHGVSQEMHDAGIRPLELRYLTEHTTADIMNEYVSLDPRGEIEKYFRRIQGLLERIGQRVQRLAESNRRLV
jgi:hypothetical protein